MIHMDLAARNVLIGSGNRCKIADFGMTQAMGEASEMHAHLPMPMPPTSLRVRTINRRGEGKESKKGGIISNRGRLLFWGLSVECSLR